MQFEQFAFVPAGDGRALVVDDGGLPHVVDAREPAALLDVVEALTGERPRYLRLAARVDELNLRVFEAVDAPGAPPERIRVPDALRPAFERCVAELDGAPVPAARPAWSRAGWHEEAEAWAGMPLEQVRVWPLSAVLRNGDVWFKACFPLFRHEPAITAALGRPRVLRVDERRAWMLMEHVEGEAGADHHAAIRAIAAVHREWSTRIEEALALGAQDRRRPSRVGHTLVHGDFHPGNVVGSTIIDWSDFAVGNPMYDVNHFLLNVEEELRGPLLETYGVKAETAAEYEAETYEDVAWSYRRITDALAPDDKWWFDREEARWLARASDVRAGRRPSRGT